MMIREIHSTEINLLGDFLYEAIFVPQGEPRPDKSIINRPELQVYIEDFGSRKDDKCFVAEKDGKIIGAVWARIMNDYGHIDDEIPSLALSVMNGHRRQGIGTALMETMLSHLKRRGYERASLSVQKANFAVKMYAKLGFGVFSEHGNEYIMLVKLL